MSVQKGIATVVIVREGKPPRVFKREGFVGKKPGDALRLVVGGPGALPWRDSGTLNDKPVRLDSGYLLQPGAKLVVWIG